MLLTEDPEDEEEPLPSLDTLEELEEELSEELDDELELPSLDEEELPAELEDELTDEELSLELELDEGQPGTTQHPSIYTGMLGEPFPQIRGSGIGGTCEHEEDEEELASELEEEDSDEDVEELELEDEELTLDELELLEDDELTLEEELELLDVLEVELLLELDDPPPVTTVSQLINVLVPPPGVHTSGPFPASIQSFPSSA